MTETPWYQDRAVLVNIIIAVISIAIAIVTVFIDANGLITLSTILLALLAGLNVALRFATGTPIAGSTTARRLSVARELHILEGHDD